MTETRPDDPTGVQDPPRATAFIVTIYGDVVEPRGGSLWMGTLIECCAEHGLNESLVRTAVSRLVSAGRLQGMRVGRKSYYSLTPSAQAEFRDAGRLLFSPSPRPIDWRICLSEGLRDEDLPPGWNRLSPSVAMAPNHPDLSPPPGLILRADDPGAPDDLRRFAARHWDLAGVAAAYDSFLHRFEPLTTQLDQPLTSAMALSLRLRLVHEYRLAALADPRLPVTACPEDWPADRARAVFVHSYLSLTPQADAHIGTQFMSDAGYLPATNAKTDTRIAGLKAEAAGTNL